MSSLMVILALAFWFGAATQMNLDTHSFHKKEKFDLNPVSILVTGVVFLGVVVYWLQTGHLPENSN